MNITSKLARAGLCSAIAVTLAGCMTSTPIYDAHFGEAARTVRAMQTLNPNASMNSDPVAGVDGRAATAAMDRYNTQFRTPQADVSAFTVGISSGSSLDSMGK
ncbi:hypothetical protein [Ralstonia solanacearum]|uniref:hypothetical protein n=1 Tax=Ralstonia solanacearum TaxID=305 RepID=UPI0007C8C7BF|nr:hypothetical protein [Ralstonia solanacearum]ATJ85559.1 hypothetical protein CDC59_04320 [Ralstonia solanacearum]OAI74602.1 lipoprotein [Ralstonia solanacearum]RCW11094.1 hypothetical protein RSP816_10720 [Ralstonia solanacearum]